MIPKTTGEKAATKNQKDVGKYRTQHTRLHDADFSVLERHYANLRRNLAVAPGIGVPDAYNQLYSISEGCVQKTTQGLSKLHRKFLGCKTEQRG